MSDPADSPTVKFHYIKTPSYTETPVHGCFGGVNPSTGRIYMAVFSERGAIPQEMLFAVDEATDLIGGELRDRRVGKEGVVRIVQNVLHFDVNVAVKLRSWLDDKIRRFAEEHPELASELEVMKNESTK